MSNSYGEKFKVTVFGQSHSEAIGCVIEGLPCGFVPDTDLIMRDIERRKGGRNAYSTARAETDTPHIISGLCEGACVGAPMCVLFYNKDTRSTDYSSYKDTPRPGHSDYTAFVRTNGNNDIRGGGEYSGRLTLPLVFAGGVAKQVLSQRKIKIKAHISEIAGIKDAPFNPLDIDSVEVGDFPVIEGEKGMEMISAIEEAKCSLDSVGGVIECGVSGMPVGFGFPMFNGTENEIARAIFAVPAVKGIEFGAGFEVARMRGSQNNDEFCFDGDKIKTVTNNCGGILGGLTNGMPIIFRVAIKPTPSIAKAQNTVSLSKKENVKIEIKGRHDPCIVPRAVPVIEAVTAIAMLNMLM